MIFVRFPGFKDAISTTHELFVQWEGFDDEESGIKDIFMAVGSTNESTDIFDFRSVTGGSTVIKEFESMQDGHQYFIILKVKYLRHCML